MSLDEASMSERHEQWMKKYGKVYKDAAEKQKRFLIFKDNVEYIESFNAAGNKSYKLGINPFADQTSDEFAASHTGYRRSHELRTEPVSVAIDSTAGGSDFQANYNVSPKTVVRTDCRAEDQIAGVEGQIALAEEENACAEEEIAGAKKEIARGSRSQVRTTCRTRSDQHSRVDEGLEDTKEQRGGDRQREGADRTEEETDQAGRQQ
ncbi:Senescence-specific cysteine protease SAG39, partial [Mucuna pruriens]